MTENVKINDNLGLKVVVRVEILSRDFLQRSCGFLVTKELIFGTFLSLFASLK